MAYGQLSVNMPNAFPIVVVKQIKKPILRWENLITKKNVLIRKTRDYKWIWYLT